MKNRILKNEIIQLRALTKMVRIMSRMWEYKGGTLKTIRCYQCEHSVNTNDNDDDDDDGNVVT